MNRTRILLALGVLAGVLTAAAVAGAKTSHAGWPARTGILYIAPNHDSHRTGTRRNDELLGGHGSDVLKGGRGSDVIWGDQHPTHNNARQHDVLIGGPSRDFIYASHGRNTIYAGAGNDVIHAHFGARGGYVDCGSGYDVVYLSHKRARHYRLRHCERRSFFTLGY